MNYLNIYKNLMQKRIKQPSTQQYTEKHHILPKSIKNNNIVVILNAREHFIAHALLVKITQKSQNKQNYFKMVYAFNRMKSGNNNQYRYNSHLYQIMKHKISEVRKELIKQYNPSKGKIWITNLKQNKMINKNQQIPEGWLRGKVVDAYLMKYNDAMNKQTKFHFINYNQDINNKILPRILINRLSKEQKERRKQQKRKLAKQYLKQYKISGYKGIIQKYNYHYTYRILLMMFKKWIPNQWKEYKELHIR